MNDPSLLIDILIIVIIIGSYLILGGLVFLKNSKNWTNRFFSFLALTVALWNLSAFVSELVTNYDAKLVLSKASYGFAAIACLSAVSFTYKFLEYKKFRSLYYANMLLTLSLTGLTLFSDKIINSLVIKPSSFDIVSGSFSPIYIGVILLLVTQIILLPIIVYGKSTGIKKNQIKFLFMGLILFSASSIFFNFILKALTGTDQYYRYGNYSALLLIISTSYALIKHRLMDIRLVVARSLAYIILLLTLAALYAGSVLGLERIFFPQYYNQFNLAQGALRTVISVVMVFLFQPLKRWITNATDKFFFKNSYNKDDLLSELSNTLGSTIVLIEMLYKVSDILTKEMKASRTLFALVKDESRLYTVQANGYKETPDVDPRDVLHITKDGLMVADELEDNSRHKSLLRQYDAAVAIPLKTEKEVVGVLLLGEKSSGDMYNQQDLSVLEIMAPEIAVAIENAKSYEEINRFNITLRQEVKRATYRLKEKNTQLMELDKAKDEFISMASHQLRTPLTAIKGYLSMLLEGDAGDIKVSQYDFINEAYSGANRMVGLINDLLNVSRMETGRFFLEPKEVDIERVVEEEVKQLQNSAKTKGLYLKMEAKGKVPHIYADETKIRQVVMNFMDNAIYYTNTGGVTVVLSHDKDNFIYEVHDTGIGVPKEQQAHMFEKFFRADNARTARPDGTGLGIYLAKRVVVDHGGQIVFNSTEGKGSVFGFKFPLKQKVEAKPVSSPAPLPEIPMGSTPTATDVAAVTKSE